MITQALLDTFHAASLTQFTRAEIDRQHQLRPLRLPARQRRTGLLQHPLANVLDQPGFLGQGNELIRTDLTTLWVHPAQQHLGTRHAVVSQHQLRLEHQLQLLARDGLAQLALQLQALVDGNLHLRGEEMQGIAPGMLGPVHGGIGLLENVRGLLQAQRVQGDADTGADRQLMAVDQATAVQAAQQFLAHCCGLLGNRLRFMAQRFEQHHELVTAETRQGIFSAQLTSQACGHFDQKGIANQMTEAIVDRLEVIQIDEQQRAQAALTILAIHGVLQAIEQQAAIG